MRKQSLEGQKFPQSGRFPRYSGDQLESRTPCGVERRGQKRDRYPESRFFWGGRLQKVPPLVIFYTTERSTTHCSAMMINKYTLHSSHGEEGDGAGLWSDDDDEIKFHNNNEDKQ